jgi:tRNA-dihydrouridine synthase
MESLAPRPGDALAQDRQPLGRPSMDEQYAVIIEQYEAMLEHYGPVIGANCARKHIGWYTRGLHGSAEFRNAFNKEADPAPCQVDALRILRPWLSRRPPNHQYGDYSRLNYINFSIT